MEIWKTKDGIGMDQFPIPFIMFIILQKFESFFKLLKGCPPKRG